MEIDGEELEIIQQQARDCLASGIDLEELAEEIYTSEANYNNADPSSQQRCWTEDEIHEAVFSVMEDD